MTFSCSPSCLLLSCRLGAEEPGCHGNRASKRPEPAYQPLEKIPVVKLKKGDAQGGAEVEEWEGVMLTVAGAGLGCSAKALHELSVHWAYESRHSGEKQINPLLPTFFFKTFQMLLNPLPPVHLQSGSNTPNACTGHVIKGVLTIPNMTHASEGLFVARKSADYGECSRGPQALHSASWQRTNPCLGNKAVIPCPAFQSCLPFPGQLRDGSRMETQPLWHRLCALMPFLGRHLIQLQLCVQKYSGPRFRPCGNGNCTSALSSAS